MRLIDGDALHDDLRKKQTWVVKRDDKYNQGYTYDQVHFAIDEQPTVDAVPVSYIQQRIDRLKILAEYEAEANGGYIGRSYMAKFELEELIKYWKAESEQIDGVRNTRGK
jgi:hypothetical protein